MLLLTHTKSPKGQYAMDGCSLRCSRQLGPLLVMEAGPACERGNVGPLLAEQSSFVAMFSSAVLLTILTVSLRAMTMQYT